MISFAFLSEELDDTDNNRYCTRIDECFVSVLRFGLIDNFLVCIIMHTITKAGADPKEVLWVQTNPLNSS